MKLTEIIENNIRDILKDGLKECCLYGAWYDLIKDILEEMGYKLSSDDDFLDEVMYTNGWEHDYYQYIFKDDTYTGYYLYGSLYYGQHRIQNETRRS